jgi:hypothetical protein
LTENLHNKYFIGNEKIEFARPSVEELNKILNPTMISEWDNPRAKEWKRLNNERYNK